MSAERKSYDGPGLFAGLLVLTVGVVFLLERNGVVHAREVFRFWPAILIAAGIAKLAQADYDTGSRIWGAILVIGGGVLLSNSLGYTDIRFADIWPLGIIGVGVLLLWRSLSGPAGRSFGQCAKAGFQGRRPSSATRLSHTAIFSGFERQITNAEFEGGELMAIFGGCVVDLRRAELKGGEAVLDATAIFGGVEIKVPETWDVVLKGSGIFGGYVDSTRPVADPAVRTGTLWVRGVALFGGVEVKNR